jgi:hypothetical protein
MGYGRSAQADWVAAANQLLIILPATGYGN